jgi:ubiquinone/menaquinone biosynthesis C-methylase UbiE
VTDQSVDRRVHDRGSVYSDPDVARTFETRRFGGPIGEIVASSQARVLAGFLGNVENRSILDVGTGTGRAARLLARAGAIVTGVDRSEEMLKVARERASAQNLKIPFLVGDAQALEFSDRSFEIAISLRLLMHMPRWQLCVSELCRVAERFVVLDYPSSQSVAAIESIARRAAHALGVRTEAYRVLNDRAVAAALARSGFRVLSLHRQFLLPIAFHKAVGSRRFTESVEAALARAGLSRRFGSPVTLLAERCASS